MIPDENNSWHYRAIKHFSALFRGITLNRYGDFYCLNCFHFYRTLNKLKRHEGVCNNHDYYRIDMPKENEKTEYLPGEKSLKAPYIVYECLLEKILPCQDNPENFYTEKKTKHKPSRYAWSLICAFDNRKNKYYFRRREDCIEKLCKDLKDLRAEIINFFKKMK